MDPADRVREAIEEFVTRVRQDLDVHGQSLAVDLVAAVRGAGAAKGERPAASDRGEEFTRLLTAVRRLDAATSLGGILEALSAGARGEAARSGLLLRDARVLRGWAGFVMGEARATEISLDADSLVAGAVDSREPVDVPAAGAGDARTTVFRAAPGHAARLMPLAVGGNVVAVLYAEGLAPDAPGHPPIRVAPLEILVRHAAARLENVTSIRTVEALTKPASVWS